MIKLDKDSSEPLYQQLIGIIKKQIMMGELKPGDRIPTEMELSKLYAISRITVRKAVELMEEEDILIKKQGIGTFVTDRKLKRDSTKFMSFSEHCRQAGVKPGSKLIIADLIEASFSYSELLRLKARERLIRIIRLRTADNEPVMVEENYFPERFSYLLGEDLNNSLYQLLGANGGYAASGQNRFTICYPTGDEASYLDVSEDDALILWRGVCFDNKGNPLHVYKNIVNPKKYEITVNSY